MRCVGEIDITRTRWSEQPTALVPTLLGNIANFAPGEGERRFEEGRRAAERQAREFLERVRALPDGARDATCRISRMMAGSTGVSRNARTERREAIARSII